MLSSYYTLAAYKPELGLPAFAIPSLTITDPCVGTLKRTGTRTNSATTSSTSTCSHTCPADRPPQLTRPCIPLQTGRIQPVCWPSLDEIRKAKGTTFGYVPSDIRVEWNGIFSECAIDCQPRRPKRRWRLYLCLAKLYMRQQGMAVKHEAVLAFSAIGINCG